MRARWRGHSLVVAVAIFVAPGGARVEAKPAPGTAAAWGANGSGQLGNGTTLGTSTPGVVNGLTDVAAVAAGGPPSNGNNGFTLALRKDGTVWAWGRNNSGQLGNGCVIGVSCTDSSTPAPVPGLTDVIAIAAGGGHSLAMLADGRVKAWGRNDSGQLGIGSTTPSSTPVFVVPSAYFLGARAIAAGGRHSLAVLKDGRIVAWGENGFGQLGDGTVTDRTLPSLVAASPLTGFTGVAAGTNHSLARYRDGRVFAWGLNHRGQLGNGTLWDSSVPVQVPGLTDIVGIAAGESHSLALRVGRTVSAWGNNASGQLGTGAAGPGSPTPVSVSGVASVVAIAAGAHHSLATTVRGELLGWGANGSGQLGVPAPAIIPAPGPIAGVRDVTTASAAGPGHSVVASVPGTLWSWGYAAWAGYGNADDSRPVPGQADRAAWAMGLAAGNYHALAVTATGRVLAVGSNHEGRLGDNGSAFDGNPFSPLPVYVRRKDGGFLADIVGVAAFWGTSLAVDAHGRAWGWGLNDTGQVGDGSVGGTRLAAVKVTGLTNAVAVAVGNWHSLALRQDGTLRAWGSNAWGQLGTGGLPGAFPTPQVVVTLVDVVGIGAGAGHSLAVDKHGAVWAWGYNDTGELGDGCVIGVTCAHSFVPKPVLGVPPAVAVAGGYWGSIALTQNGEVWTWGGNASGQLGNGCTIAVNCVASSVPAPVPGLSNVVAIAAGSHHAVAVTADGWVWTWGANSNGQLGNGCTLAVNCVDSSTPIAILEVFPGPGSPPSPGPGNVRIAAGDWNTWVAFPAAP